MGIGAHQIISLVDFKELNVLKLQPFSARLFGLIKVSSFLCKKDKENIYSLVSSGMVVLTC